jgi:2',3'-cyclic-nucleotide 2'-phosphodiesterase (5'-nucleotidase family)
MSKCRRWLGLGALVLLLYGAVACAGPSPTVTPPPTPQPTPGPLSLTVLYTNDGWGYTEPCACDPSLGGLARRATFIESVRDETRNVLVVDAGDSLLTLQRVGDLEQGKLLVEAYNRMGYDAVALGGLDFRMGLGVMREQIQAAHFPVLSANTTDPQTGDLLDKGYTIVERGGHRIALIGLTDPKTVVEVTQGHVQATEPVQALLDVLAEAKAESDIIVVVSHLGMLFDANLGQVAPDIDLIVSGLDKEVYDPPVVAQGAVIVSAGSRGEYIGRIDLEFDANGNLLSHDGYVQALTDQVADDAEMRSWMAQSGLVTASALKPGGSGQFTP